MGDRYHVVDVTRVHCSFNFFSVCLVVFSKPSKCNRVKSTCDGGNHRTFERLVCFSVKYKDFLQNNIYILKKNEKPVRY